MIETEVPAGESPLPPYFHAWGTKPDAVTRNKVVVLKSVPEPRPEEPSKPDVNSTCFPTTETNLVGCCLCDKETVAGKSNWGFKSHCFFAHPYPCSYKDLLRHSTSYLRLVEAAYSEALVPDEAGRKGKAVTSFFNGASTKVERVDSLSGK